MPQIHSRRSKPVTAALTLVLASVVLAACGGSSSSTPTSTTASTSTNASATTPKPGAAGPGASHFTALRECLQKEGITLPQRKSGQRGGFFGGAGGPHLPAGVTLSKLQAALKKCGGVPRGTFAGRDRRLLNSPAIKRAYAKFATCMREHGVNLPAANTSGGPIFNTKGINTSSATFKTAAAKCRSDLPAFPARPGAGGPGGAAPGSPPTTG
jgi:hypothetical protein